MLDRIAPKTTRGANILGFVVTLVVATATFAVLRIAVAANCDLFASPCSPSSHFVIFLQGIAAAGVGMSAAHGVAEVLYRAVRRRRDKPE